MEKYSLSFKNPQVEKLYSDHQQQQYQYKFHLLITLSATTILVINIIQNFQIEENVSMNYLKIASAVTLSLNALLAHFQRKFTKVALFIANIAICMSEVRFRSTFDVYDGYLVGSNAQAAHVLIIFNLPFFLGGVANLSYFCFRVINTSIQSGPLNATQIAYSITTTFFMSFCHYFLERGQRNLFLATLRDNQIEVVIPTIMSKPFSIFSWDSLKFRSHITDLKRVCFFKHEQEDCLNYFLSNSTVKGVQLKEYLYRILRSKNTASHSFTSRFQQKQFFLTFHQFNQLHQNMALTIDNSEVIAEKNVRLSQEIQKKLTQNYQLMVRQLLRMFKQTKNKDILLSILQIQLSTASDEKLVRVSVKNALSKLFKILRRTGLRYQIQARKNYFIRTYKSRFLIFVLEILKSARLKPHITVMISQDAQGQLEISFMGLQIRAVSRLYVKLKSIFVDTMATNYDQTDPTFQIWQYRFYKEPMEKFQ